MTFKEFALAGRQHTRGDADDAAVPRHHRVPLCDQEVLCRHLHKVAHDYVDAYGGVGKDKS